MKVPISLVCKMGSVKDGKAPLFLSSYDSYGFSTDATFNAGR